MRRTRGATLIEMMVAVAVLAIATGLLVGPFEEYLRAARRARAVAAVAMVLDQEMERARACPDRACLDALRTETATSANRAPSALTWSRPLIRREIRLGPDGTHLVQITAERPGEHGPRTLSALVKVAR